MMRKVKVKRPKKSSTLKRMNINLYGDNVTAPKLELPTAQFGDKVLGRSNQPDPGNIRSTTKTSAIEEAKRRQELKDQGVGKTIGLGAAGLLTGALSSIPIVGGAFKGLNEKVQEKDKSGVAGITSGIGKAAIGTTSAVLSGGTMGTGDIAEGVGDVMGGSSEIAYNKGNDKKSERLGKAGQAFDTIAPIADMASGLAGGIKGAEGAKGMFKGPEGIKGGMKSLLGGMPSAEGGMKGVTKGFDTLDSFDTFDMNTTSEVNSLPFGKFGTKLPLEMELMPEGGKMVDGYLHEEGGVITKHRGKAVAEIEGGEGITKGGIVFSDTTINPETNKPFSKDAKKLIKSKDNSKEGETTRRLAEEELYIKQEKAKEMQGLVNRGEDMKKYKKGGSLKAIPSDNKGLPQLPESVRNQMGYMKSGGGLWANIHAKRKRIEAGSGEKKAKPGDDNYPGRKQWELNTAMYGKKLQKGGKTAMDEYESFKAYVEKARQAIGTNDTKTLKELGISDLYNENDLSRDFGELQRLRKQAGLGIIEEGKILFPHVGQQIRGTVNQWLGTNFKEGGKVSTNGKKLNLPKMQDGAKISKKQLKTLTDQVSSGSLTFSNGADFSEMNMAGPRTAYVDGKEQIVESPINSFTDLGLRSLKVFPKKLDNFKLDKFNNFKRDKFDYEMGTPSIQGDIYSSTEKTVTGKPKIKSLSERFLSNPDYSSKYNKINSLYERKKEEEDGDGGKGNLTPGDITQLAGNMVAPLANLAAMRSIRENTVDLGRDRSITREQRISTADMERTARQEAAATRAGLTQLGSDAMKSAVAANATKAIQDAQLEAGRLNTQLAMSKDQLDMQRSQFNVGQADKEAIDKQTRRDLATTTGLTAAEQTGKALVDLGLTKNQGLTNAAQLKVLREAFPEFTITQDNMKSVIRALATGKEENIIKYRKPEGE